MQVLRTRRRPNEIKKRDARINIIIFIQRSALNLKTSNRYTMGFYVGQLRNYMPNPKTDLRCQVIFRELAIEIEATMVRKVIQI
jgi:hypothetical protein